MALLYTEADFLEALEALRAQCAFIDKAVKETGVPEARLRNKGFPTLMRTICAQQISVKAAASVWGRLEAFLGSPPTPQSVLAVTPEELRGCGLSLRKAGYVQDLAARLEDSRLDLDCLSTLAEKEAIKHLTQVKGFGPWSAQIYLMFAEGWPDLWPSDDVGLQAGLKILMDLPERPTAAATNDLVAHWSPYRTVGATMTWHYYGAMAL